MNRLKKFINNILAAGEKNGMLSPFVTINIREFKYIPKYIIRAYIKKYPRNYIQIGIIYEIYSKFLYTNNNYSKALNAYLKAYNEGNNEALICLGNTYLNIGLKEIALNYYLLAAELGYGYAFFKLGIIFSQINEPMYHLLAKKYYNLASNFGYLSIDGMINSECIDAYYLKVYNTGNIPMIAMFNRYLSSYYRLLYEYPPHYLYLGYYYWKYIKYNKLYNQLLMKLMKLVESCSYNYTQAPILDLVYYSNVTLTLKYALMVCKFNCILYLLRYYKQE